MAQYFLKLSGSNNIESIIEWDGVSPYTPPPGYVIELVTTTASINYAPSSSQYQEPIFGGKLFGEFSGELTGSITINGQTIDEILNETPYGTLTLYSSSMRNTSIKSGSFKINDTSSLFLPLSNNKSDNQKFPYYLNYSSSFAKIINEEIKDYVVTFKNKENPFAIIDFLVKKTEVTSSVSASVSNTFYKLSSNKINDNINQLINQYSTDPYSDYYGSEWYIDFDFREKEKGIENLSNNGKRKIINFYTSSNSIEIPDWAEKITVYAIGAGGGGGGGASGYIHANPYAIPHQYDSVDDYVLDSVDYDIITDSYIPRLDKSGSNGHEVVTGGGGGAGGCVVIETLSGKDAENARGKLLSIAIGSGGKGGSGSSYVDDIVAVYGSSIEKEKNSWKYLEYILKSDKEKSSHPGLFSGKLGVVSNYSAEYHGKPGGNTFVVLSNLDGSNSKKIVQAQGGNGGSAGVAIKKAYELFHYFCPILDHWPVSPIVPGGANDGVDNIGSEIRIGGPGGYGIAMPIATKLVSDPEEQKLLKQSKSYRLSEWNLEPISYAANLAPNIPWNKGDINDLSYGYGTIKRTSNISTDDDIIKKYERNGKIIPDKAAPTGGGGGVGASYQGLNQISSSVWIVGAQVHSQLGIFEEWVLGQPLPEYLKLQSNFITGSIVYGLGGVANFDEHLIDEFDENGVNYRWPLSTWKNYYGGNGGYGYYGTYTDKILTDRSGNPVYNVDPSSGLFFAIGEAAGYGGGGGAGTYVLSYDQRYSPETGIEYRYGLTPELYIPDRGQNGADGQNGFAIVVIEQL